MAKAAEAFRTISEVAEELELHKHVLRFWEVKFPQIKPMKRGGGRRYYRPADLELLRGIRHLLHSEGYTIKGVQRILRERGVDAVKRVGSELIEGGKMTGLAALGAPDGDGLDGNQPPPVAEAAPEKARTVAPPAPPAPKSAPAKARPARREITASRADTTATARSIARAIAELETCRAILQGAAIDSALRGDQIAVSKRALGAPG